MSRVWETFCHAPGRGRLRWLFITNWLEPEDGAVSSRADCFLVYVKHLACCFNRCQRHWLSRKKRGWAHQFASSPFNSLPSIQQLMFNLDLVGRDVWDVFVFFPISLSLSLSLSLSHYPTTEEIKKFDFVIYGWKDVLWCGAPDEWLIAHFLSNQRAII